jgi:peptidyl-prolyl cis-trans isomerase C
MQSKRTAPYVFLLACSAATAAFAADQSAPILTVGSASMTAADVSRRLAALPAYQVARYGSTPEEIKKRFVQEVLVPEMLYGEEAKSKKADQAPGTQSKLKEALKDALDRNLREEVLKNQPVTAEDLKKYYDENKSRFETPKRIRVWRIQVADEAAAKEILAKAKGTEGVKAWSEAAREKSLDKATAQRSGDLGFVRADGSTDVPRVQVDPGIFVAADKVQDGALVPQPIKEGDKWSVIWRRGSVEATKRTLEDETPSIRQLIERRRIDTARQDLLSNLKKEHVKDLNPDLLSNIDASMFGPAKRDSPHDKDGAARKFRRDGGLRAPKLKAKDQPGNEPNQDPPGEEPER